MNILHQKKSHWNKNLCIPQTTSKPIISTLKLPFLLSHNRGRGWGRVGSPKNGHSMAPWADRHPLSLNRERGNRHFHPPSARQEQGTNYNHYKEKRANFTLTWWGRLGNPGALSQRKKKLDCVLWRQVDRPGSGRTRLFNYVNESKVNCYLDRGGSLMMVFAELELCNLWFSWRLPLWSGARTLTFRRTPDNTQSAKSWLTPL